MNNQTPKIRIRKSGQITNWKMTSLRKSILFLLLIHFIKFAAFTQNVGIGTSNTLNARLTVSGGVLDQVAMFQSIKSISLDCGNSPSIGFNYNNGKALATGTGGLLKFNGSTYGGFELNYFNSVNAGIAFSGGIDVMKFADYSALGLGKWLDLNNNGDSRLNVPTIMRNTQNGNLNLLPIGAIYFRVSAMNNGSNATKVIYNVGNTASLYDNVFYFHVQQGDALSLGTMNLALNLDLITKDYEDVYIVGAPNFFNLDNDTQSCFAKFIRNQVGVKDRIQIYYNATLLDQSTEVFGTLLVYGTKN